jgi:type I restriction enzyme, S subunit
VTERLPDGWTRATIADVTEDVDSFDPRKRPDQTICYVDISSIDSTRLTIGETKKFRGADAPSRARRQLRPGDVVFSNVRTYLRNIARVDGLPDPAIASTGFTVLRPTPAVDTDYIFRYVTTDDFLQRVTPKQTGTHYPATSVRVVRGQDIPLPPLKEQRRIAARLNEIEDLLASVSARLDAVRASVDQLRGAVLAAACSGRLTKDWRDPSDDPSWDDDLLLRAEERRRDQTERFVRPQLNLHARPDEIPTTWSYAPLGLLLRDLRYGTSRRAAYDRPGTPVLRIPNVSSGALDVEDMKFADLDDREMRALQLNKGDLLMIRSNGSVQLVGVTAAVTSAGEGMVYAGYLMRLRVDKDLLNPEFLRLILASPQLRDQIELPARSTSGVHNINAHEVSGLGIPLPSLDEQAEIVRRVESMLGAAHRLSESVARVEQTLVRASKAALAKALRGELVPTEQALAAKEGRKFESAEELLARVTSNGSRRLRAE